MNTEEKLIYLVEKYDCLYNVNANTYSHRNTRNKAWAKVSGEMNLSLFECQRKWKKLRDCYIKALKLRETCGGSAAMNKPIRYEKELEFLKPYIHSRSQISNLDSSETEENLTDTESPQNVNLSSPREWPASPNSSRNEDPTDKFYLMISCKVKNMPKKMQVQIERDIFRIVNEAEIVLANDNLPSQPEIWD